MHNLKIDVLDHGFVELIEAWGVGREGTDAYTTRDDGGAPYVEVDRDHEVGIVEAARQSTQGSFRGWEQDAKLLRYLHEHHHATPFEFAGMVIEVQAPIFVFREWHRHRTQSFNEASARYSPLPDLYYQPDMDNLERRAIAANVAKTKQEGALGNPADRVTCAEWREDIGRFYQDAERLYQRALREGIPKELARVVMPVGHYTKMRAAANLRNWLAFLTLRMDPAAQWEIRQFAEAVGKCIAAVFPQTWALFSEARHG